MQRFSAHYRNGGCSQEKPLDHMTEATGIFSINNGTYFVDPYSLSFGPEWLLQNITARSDYDRDGTYETLEEELDGLAGEIITIMGVLKEDTIMPFYINHIWYKNPVRVPQEISQLSGLLTHDEKYAIGNQTIYFGSMKQLLYRVAQSDYDEDGQLESMYYELDGLISGGNDVVLDGFYKNDSFIPVHINGMWYPLRTMRL
jgi:hypothetical protein